MTTFFFILIQLREEVVFFLKQSFKNKSDFPCLGI